MYNDVAIEGVKWGLFKDKFVEQEFFSKIVRSINYIVE